MQQQLINLSPDLKKLRDKGYELEVNGGYICIHHIPYVNKDKNVKIGALVCPLSLASPTLASRPPNHTMFFMGEHPCHKDGSVMNEIINSSPDQILWQGMIGNHLFSSRPSKGYYDDYYQKFSRYIALLSAPAKSIDKKVTAQTYKPFIDTETESVFNYFDTNSSRANITQVNEKLKGQKIAIIGLGGTGSYILDLVAKTPVSEIHLFDPDDFSQHNAFRSPGSPSIDDLNQRKQKVTYLSEIYSKMHKGIIPHAQYVTRDNMDIFKLFTYVFICVDKNSVRAEIIKELLSMNIPFIDSGLGVTLVDDSLIGIVRSTTGTSNKNDHISKRISSEDTDENEYVTNIQIADLNSLNASLSVIKWKKLSGFYQDLLEEHNSSYSINVAQLFNGDTNT